jgi:cellulose synthase/poly-beta-1,6-N-acetylglucosamine synthase-like glycosyltransferase
MTKEDVIRPNYGLYDPDYKTNSTLYYIISAIVFLLLIWYTVYVAGSLIAIITSTIGVLAITLNLMIFFVEFSIGYYALLLVYHLGKAYAPIRNPLKNEFNLDNVNDDDNLPMVSIMLPMYKEPFSVIKQTIKAALDINYPRDRYEMVIVDDTPDNPELQKYCKSNDLKYVTRDNRDGFKAGGINNALKYTSGKYLLFIDADHIVERNIIKNCLIAWREDTIAVQTRIDFVNMRTLLTTISGFLQLQFFSLFQRARRSTGSAIFAGGATLFSKEILMTFGGFDPLTIADDTDNSFIFRSAGYRIEYIDVVGAWALVPWDPLHLIRQVWRWLTGITRSFRARWLTILRGKSPIYVKIDHLSTGFFPTLAILGWGVAFLMIMLIQLQISIIRTPLLTDFTFFGIVIALIGISPIFAGIVAVLLDDKRIFIHQKPLYYKILVFSGFYLLILAAQPLLIGAILKGLTGIKVSFNRTPKEKNAIDTGLGRIKMYYLVYSIGNFILGLTFLFFAYSLSSLDARSTTLYFSAYASIIPLMISILWYWKLEKYLDEVSDITAFEILEEASFN